MILVVLIIVLCLVVLVASETAKHVKNVSLDELDAILQEDPHLNVLLVAHTHGTTLKFLFLFLFTHQLQLAEFVGL